MVGHQVLALRSSLNMLGDGFVEAIDANHQAIAQLTAVRPCGAS